MTSIAVSTRATDARRTAPAASADRGIAPANGTRDNTAAARRERGRRLLHAVDGPAGVAVVDRLAQDFPDFADLLLAFPFGDIYARPALGLREREIATVAALCALGNAGPQLRVHLQAALHVGCAPAELVEIVMQMAVYAGFPAALNGLQALREVFAQQGIALPLQDA